jgi:hypothetical protein
MPAFSIVRPLTMNTRHRASGQILLLLLAALLLCSAGGMGGGRSSADSGRMAIHQRCLDIERPAVAMIVALQPGYEDLPLLAYLRTHLGANTIVTFLTNGEGTPGDTLGRFPGWMTGERKLEAERVASLLDADVWFANIPDAPGAGTANVMTALWDSVGATKRLTQAIRKHEPDVIVLCADRRVAGNSSIRESLALRTVEDAATRAETTVDTSRRMGFLPWKVSRVVVQTTGNGLPRAFKTQHPLLNVSSIAVAQSVGQSYRTLRLQIGDWVADGREYHLVSGHSQMGPPVAPDELLRGLPAISPKVKGIEKAIRTAVRIGPKGVRTAALAPVSRAIDATEHVLTTLTTTLTRPEQRLMVTWKNGLEALRCAVLGVSAHAVPSESLLTASQIFYLRVDPPRPRMAQGQTEIVFPLAIDGEWMINGVVGYHFPLDSASTFTVLTPEEIPFTVPASEYGLTQPAMSTTFPYVVVHKDPEREYNFMYNGMIRLRMGPRRSFALRTPRIIDDRSSPVIAELQNFSRDSFKGTISLSDTSGGSTQLPVAFDQKDQILRDTLYLPGDPPEGEGRRLFTLELSGRGGRRVIAAQRVNAVIDTAASVRLYSTIDSSPLADALRVLRQPHGVAAGNEVAFSLNLSNTVVLDRDLLSDTACTERTRQALTQWIRGGGHAIVFPQHGRGAGWLTALCGATFETIDPLATEAEVKTDSSSVFATPNRITPGDWEGWVESRAFVRIHQNASQAGAVRRAWSGPHSLLATVPVGNGSVTLVAADLLSQFTNCHPGAYRLLANLISHAGGR